MPAGDGTGPNGTGPLTGRAAGYCAGYGVPGYANPVRGGRGGGFCGGFGGGRGFGGRGLRNRFYGSGMPFGGRGFQNMTPRFDNPAPYDNSPEAELRMLKSQAEFMKREVEAITLRIMELESLSSEKK